MEMSSDCNSNIHDALLFDILMKVEPRDIFKCILVSKDWLSVITSPLFRTNYLNKWKDSSSILVGLLLYRRQQLCEYDYTSGVQIVATSNLGASMMARNPLLQCTGDRYFISKSLKGGLLLFRTVVNQTCIGGSWCLTPVRYFVGKSISGGPPVELPQPPVDNRCVIASILCDDEDGEDYRVILAFEDVLLEDDDVLLEDNDVLLVEDDDVLLEDDDDDDDDETEETENDMVTYVMSILTYCSSTGNWKQSTLTFDEHDRFRMELLEDCGVVTKGGNYVIYWELAEWKHRHYSFVKWDMNRDCVGLIPRPAEPANEEVSWITTYGVSEDTLLAAMWSTRWYNGHCNDAWECEWFNINILAFDDDKKVWESLYSVRPAAIWNSNLPLLTTVFHKIFKRDFQFVAFVPGKSDSVYLVKRGQLFVYHFATGKLEHVDHVRYTAGIDPFRSDHHPLTLLDIRIWPSSPTSLQLPNCS